MAIRLNDAIRNAMVNSVITGLAGTSGSAGMLRIYSGTQPGTAGGTSGTSLLLVQFSGVSWAAASNGTSGILTAYSGTASTTGTAAWGRLSGSDGTSHVIDGDCGITTQDFLIDAVVLTAGGSVSLTSASIIQPAS